MKAPSAQPPFARFALMILAFAGICAGAYAWPRAQEPVAPGGDSSSATTPARAVVAEVVVPAESADGLTLARAAVRASSANGVVAPRDLSEKHRLALIARVAELRELLGGRPEDDDDREAEDAWLRRLQGVLASLSDAARHSPAAARWLWEQVEIEERDEVGVRLGRALRASDDPAFLAEMQGQATGAERPLSRRAALLALESKPVELWLRPTASGFRGDPDPNVRDEAAGLLSRSLVDRRFVRNHREIRATIQAGLTDADPASRKRALDAMLSDRTASAHDLELSRALLDDPDPSVREAAQRLIPVMQRAIDRRRR